jgi:NAD(P)-dependent dehydrogenase (short-subunit alcohol dehydrogenase family)/acyl dehydratase
MSLGEAVDRAGSELRVGLTAEFERELRAEDVLAFAALSGDNNPLHVDEAYASGTNYGRPIVHGALQIALASAMAGMHLPGKRVVLGATRSRFAAPLHYPCTVLVRGEIVAFFPAAASGTLRVRIEERASSSVTAEVHMDFSLHEARPGELLPESALRAEGERPLLVVTGASGAVGSALLARFAQSFDVLGFVRRLAPIVDGTFVDRTIACDLESADWEGQASLALGGRRVYGVVHTAWPGVPRGGLLELELSAIQRQLDFGGTVTVRLARWLLGHLAGAGRLVLLGSTAGTAHPELGLAGYSLGKATLEHTLRLLAPELARRAVTINGILPSYMPLGMNANKTERATLLEASRVPFGRLCTIEDVAACAEYLLSPAAEFVTGQLLPLTGGRL